MASLGNILLFGISCFQLMPLQAVEPVTISIVVSVGLWGADKVYNWWWHDPVGVENMKIEQQRLLLFLEQEKALMHKQKELDQARTNYQVCEIEQKTLGNKEFLGNTKVSLACAELAKFYALLSDLKTQEEIYQERKK